MGRETDPRLGWQGWLWLAILAVCLVALSLGIGFRYGIEATEGSADFVSSGNVESTVDVPQTISLLPASTKPRSNPGVARPGPSTPAAAVPSTSFLGSSVDWFSTSRPTTVSTPTSRQPTVSTTTSRPTTRSTSTTFTSGPTTVSVTTAAAQPVRLASTPTPTTTTPTSATPTTRPTTSTSEPTTTTTKWSGPVAVDDHLAADEGKEVKPKVLDNDAAGDAPLDKDTLSITSGPANAESHKVHDDHLHYKPTDGFVGVDRIRYRICDEVGRCDTATVTITVG